MPAVVLPNDVIGSAGGAIRTAGGSVTRTGAARRRCAGLRRRLGQGGVWQQLAAASYSQEKKRDRVARHAGLLQFDDLGFHAAVHGQSSVTV